MSKKKEVLLITFIFALFSFFPSCKKNEKKQTHQLTLQKLKRRHLKKEIQKKLHNKKKKRHPKKRKIHTKPKQIKLSMERYLNRPPKGFVELKKFIPNLRLHIGYHTPNNFTGAPLPGYGASGAWMVKKAAQALKKVQKDLAKKGLGLLVYDAYRPMRASQGMVAWAQRTGKLYLFKKGYIARYSGHNRGHTVDLTIISLKTKKPLDMGTPWDTLNTKSHTRNAKGQALKNRYLLKNAMKRRGFRPYYREWWHFHYPMRGLRRRDVPYGCYEAPEHKWHPQKNWNKKGFKMPSKWYPKPCK